MLLITTVRRIIIDTFRIPKRSSCKQEERYSYILCVKAIHFEFLYLIFFF